MLPERENLLSDKIQLGEEFKRLMVGVEFGLERSFGLSSGDIKKLLLIEAIDNEGSRSCLLAALKSDGDSFSYDKDHYRLPAGWFEDSRSSGVLALTLYNKGKEGDRDKECFYYSFVKEEVKTGKFRRNFDLLPEKWQSSEGIKIRVTQIIPLPSNGESSLSEIYNTRGSSRRALVNKLSKNQEKEMKIIVEGIKRIEAGEEFKSNHPWLKALSEAYGLVRKKKPRFIFG